MPRILLTAFLTTMLTIGAASAGPLSITSEAQRTNRPPARAMVQPPGADERIFEPFGRAANARHLDLPGMGLGLHICRQIAEAHGGRMWAHSDGEGQGMTVGMWLPPA